MVDDPYASAADLARVVETDPALSAQVLRLANSPFYGLSNTVASAGRAVMLLGFTTVRALAVSGACSLLSSSEDVFPPGFWPHAVNTAVGSAAVARRIGLPTSDAFTAGLLHDIGSALLYRRDPERHGAVIEAARFDPDVLLTLETRRFGTTHAEVGAEVLRSWRFPPPFVRTVRNHHRNAADLTDTLTRAVVAGEALAQLLDGAGGHEPRVDAVEYVRWAGVRSISPEELVEEMRRELAQMAWFLEIES
jgi:putative nucleotidyltransferase with HDIG domain